MYSNQIAIKYLAPKLNDPKEIFLNEEIFELVLFWARESAREFFATQITKMFLVHYVDDIGPIVDEYLFSRAKKIYKDATKKRIHFLIVCILVKRLLGGLFVDI